MTTVTGLSLRSYGDTPLAHAHGHHQAVLPLEGALEMEVAGRGGRVDAAALVVVAGGALHSCRATGRNRFLVLDWEDDGAADDFAERLVEAGQRRPFVGLDPALQPLLRFLDTAVASDRLDPGERRDWGRLLLRRLGHGLAHGLASRPSSHPRRLSRALAFAQANLAEALTVERLAGAAHTSAGHLHGLFRRHLGRSPMAHVADLRLERAMQALAQGDTPIAELAAACGYSDQTALTRAMKRRHGVTPAAYRRRHRH
jgi:AraC-like DNA-binding protein